MHMIFVPCFMRVIEMGHPLESILGRLMKGSKESWGVIGWHLKLGINNVPYIYCETKLDESLNLFSIVYLWDMLEWWFEIGWLYKWFYKLLTYVYVHLANLDELKLKTHLPTHTY
jgi:hypothetical protein